MTPEEQAAARRFLVSLAVLTGLTAPAIRRILNSAALPQVADAFPWAQFGDALRGFSDDLAGVFRDAARPPSAGVTLRMDLIDERAVAWAEQHSSRFIVEIVDEQRATIRQLVADAVRGNATVDDLADTLTRTIGLHSRYATAVESAWQSNYLGQINAGRSPSQAKAVADRLADNYRQRLLRARAQTIARTEIHAAQNAGRLAGWEDAISQGLASTRSRKQWITYDPCQVCQPMDGEIVLWNENFSNGNSMPAAHPNCVCQAILLEAAA